MSDWKISVKTGAESIFYLIFCLRLARKSRKAILKYQKENILQYLLLRLPVENSGELDPKYNELSFPDSRKQVR